MRSAAGRRALSVVAQGERIVQALRRRRDAGGIDMISEQHKHVFENLVKAVQYGDAGMIEAFDMKQEKVVTLLCAFQKTGGEVTTIPFAQMFDENPMERYLPQK